MWIGIVMIPMLTWENRNSRIPSFDGADLDKNARNGCYLFNCNLRINLNERMVEKWSGLGGLAHLGDPCIEQSPSRQCL